MKYISNQTYNNEQVYLETECLKTDFLLSSRDITIDAKNYEIEYNFNDLFPNEESASVVLEANCSELNLNTNISIDNLEDLISACITLIQYNEIPENNDYIKNLIDKVTNKLLAKITDSKLIESFDYQNVNIIIEEDMTPIGFATGFYYSSYDLILRDSDIIKEIKTDDKVNIIINLPRACFLAECKCNNDNNSFKINLIKKLNETEIEKYLPERFKTMKTIEDFYGDKEEFSIYKRNLILGQNDSELYSIDFDDIDF